MRFVIDETSWKFDELTTSDCVEMLESFLDMLEDVQNQGHTTYYSEELFYISVLGDKSFYDLYSDSSSIHIPWETQVRFATLLNQLSTWENSEENATLSHMIQIADNAEECATSIAWAHKQTIQGSANTVACFVFPHIRSSGSFDISVDAQTTKLWLIANKKEYRDFFRWFIVKNTKNPDEMSALAASAFPDIDFIEDVFNGIKNMSKPYRELVDDLVCHLGAFSDHGSRIFSGSWKDVPANFGALGVEITDENGKTKSNSDARRARTKSYHGSDIVFWWHSKIEPHQNRIHISPDGVKNGGNILIGIFCNHLTT
jgi:hypothetical protein